MSNFVDGKQLETAKPDRNKPKIYSKAMKETARDARIAKIPWAPSPAVWDASECVSNCLERMGLLYE